MENLSSTFLYLSKRLPESTKSFVCSCVCGSDIRCKVLDKYWSKDVGAEHGLEGCVCVSGWKGGGAANVWVINFGRCNE